MKYYTLSFQKNVVQITYFKIYLKNKNEKRKNTYFWLFKIIKNL